MKSRSGKPKVRQNPIGRHPSEKAFGLEDVSAPPNVIQRTSNWLPNHASSLHFRKGRKGIGAKPAHSFSDFRVCFNQAIFHSIIKHYCIAARVWKSASYEGTSLQTTTIPTHLEVGHAWCTFCRVSETHAHCSMLLESQQHDSESIALKHLV